MPEWQRCKHREEQTEITDYIRDEQKPTKVAIDYGIQGNSPGPATATATATRAKISNKLCKKLYWPWATFQLKMAEPKTSGQTEREREREADEQTDGQIARETDGQTGRRIGQTCRQSDLSRKSKDTTTAPKFKDAAGAA